MHPCVCDPCLQPFGAIDFILTQIGQLWDYWSECCTQDSSDTITTTTTHSTDPNAHVTTSVAPDVPSQQPDAAAQQASDAEQGSQDGAQQAGVSTQQAGSATQPEKGTQQGGAATGQKRLRQPPLVGLMVVADHKTHVMRPGTHAQAHALMQQNRELISCGQVRFPCSQSLCHVHVKIVYVYKRVCVCVSVCACAFYMRGMVCPCRFVQAW